MATGAKFKLIGLTYTRLSVFWSPLFILPQKPLITPEFPFTFLGFSTPSFFSPNAHFHTYFLG